MFTNIHRGVQFQLWFTLELEWNWFSTQRHTNWAWIFYAKNVIKYLESRSVQMTLRLRSIKNEWAYSEVPTFLMSFFEFSLPTFSLSLWLFLDQVCTYLVVYTYFLRLTLKLLRRFHSLMNLKPFSFLLFNSEKISFRHFPIFWDKIL